MNGPLSLRGMRRMGWCILLLTTGLLGQNTSDDSLLASRDEDMILYQVKWARLGRLQQEMLVQDERTPLAVDILQAIQEADSVAQSGDFILATAYLDIALHYLEQKSIAADREIKPLHLWQMETIAGSDLWQQKYSISLVDQDSAIYESQGNPYLGMRLTYRGRDARGAVLHALGEVKYGHAWGTGAADLGYEAPIGARLSLRVTNRLEGTHYQRARSLRYWNNQFRGHFTWHPATWAAISVEQEAQSRRYLHPSTFFTSYRQNQSTLRLQGEWPHALRSEVRFDHRRRHYREIPQQNFSENLATLYWYPTGFRAWSLRGTVQSRHRAYHSGFIDSLLTNDFHEFYAQSMLTVGGTAALSLQLSASWNRKNYLQPDQSTPDYHDIIVEPTLNYMLNGHYTLKAGYRFRQKKHHAAVAASNESVAMEDFYAHAPVAGFEMSFGTLLVNIYDVYEIRRYTDASPAGFTLYSDRNTHSLFVYLACSLSAHWSLNAMINIDQDLARNEQGSDARSNILNFELLYKF